ncbi:MAG: hypothetical protein RL258_111, partial [Pseudomonadota bacterium]
ANGAGYVVAGAATFTLMGPINRLG